MRSESYTKKIKNLNSTGLAMRLNIHALRGPINGINTVDVLQEWFIFI